MKPMPSARWRTYDLTVALSRDGWGDLSGRSMQGIRSTLHALVALLPYGSGQGLATAAQVADASGLSIRWTRRCLHLMEDAELIDWTRGGVVGGKPAPGYFRIKKTALVQLIGGARPMLAAIQRARAEQTARRLAGIRFLKPRGRHRRTSDHAALSAHPHPPTGRNGVPSTGVDDGAGIEMLLHLTEEHSERATRGGAATRAALAAARRAKGQP